MTDEMKEIIIPAVMILFGAGATIGGSIAGWGIKRVFDKQDETCKALAESMKETNETLKDIRNDLAANVARVSILETKEKIREERNQERHIENKQTIEEQKRMFTSIWKSINDFGKTINDLAMLVGRKQS